LFLQIIPEVPPPCQISRPCWCIKDDTFVLYERTTTNVQLAVVVKISGTDHPPMGVGYRDQRIGADSITAVHIPNRVIVVGMPPENVGFAVVVE